MTRLLNDILDFSKVEAGQMTIAQDVFDLPATLQACATLIAPTLLAKKIDLAVQLSPQLPQFARGDALRLRQILLNLLGNAAKFTEAGTVALRAEVDDGDNGAVLRIEVEDTGIGIPEDRQAAIFDPFVQGATDTAATFGGTGLGLPISVQLARLMGGELSLSSERARGTLIVLTLPLTVASAPEAGVVAPATMTRIEARPEVHVLVAEDHDVNQILVSAMLKQLGCRVDIAPDGARAVEMVTGAARSDPYALVLMDLQMPKIGGIEACRLIRAKGLAADVLPIIALTANAYADDIAACLTAGMQGHVVKPIKLADLAAVIERWTSRAPLAAEPARASPQGHVVSRYRARKAQTLQRLEQAAVLPTLDGRMLDELSDLLHKLAGTAGMFGEATLGDRARELEGALKACPPADGQAAVVAALPGLRAAA
jgi:CheY-like chemotaxis protein